MKTNNTFNPSMDDMVFDGRNKMYGAFELRQNYGSTVFRAICVTVVAFLLALFILSIMNRLDLLRKELEAAYQRCTGTPQETVIEPEYIENIKVLPKEDVGKSAAGHSGQYFHASNNVTATDTVTQQYPDNEMHTDVQSGAGNGESNTGGTTAGQQTGSITTEEKTKTKYDPREEMPEFLGGDLGLWIEERLPHPAIEEDVVTTIRFVVDENGKVRDVAILLSSGYPECDAAAVAVISKLSKPGFKPGMQQGKTVAVTYDIPISFTVEE